MISFYDWYINRGHDEDLSEFINQGHSEDWSDAKAADQRFNDGRYAVRDVRSKYQANMKADAAKKRKRKKTK